MSDIRVKQTFFTHETVVLTGFSKYMLDYLAREDVFRPSGRNVGVPGNKREYSFEDVVLLRALKTICAGKGKIRHFTRSLKNYRKTFGPLQPGQRVEKFLVVQGNRLCAYDSGEGAIDLITGQRTLSFVLDLGMVVQDLERHVVIDPKTNAIRLTTAAQRKADAERERNWAPVRARREKAKKQAT
ncbi:MULTISPECIES: hypothetical protein [unclassified Duganella]|uniref:hypothetical protein n=1 Tax=unclassified Duganella TaxID=2636909 RepID=UPI000E357242|nr:MULTISPECIES: hypothetical protein [unclassified Duganella]RFP08277.1 hypothetical protein D0T23_29195 [Duganella sp. BJB475]RFP22509.1 hypothetical protein D0T21_30160 [Duganella sp. BJB476]